MKILLLFLLLCGAAAAEPLTINRGLSVQANIAPNKINIMTKQGAIVIDCHTGEVTLPPGLKLSDASLEFWKALARAFPDAREAILKDPH